MEITYEESEKMIAARLAEHPELTAIVNNPSFTSTVSGILRTQQVDSALREQVGLEIKMVLAQYAPLDKLSENISQGTGLPIEKATRIADMIEAVMLGPVYDELLAFNLLWETELEKTNNIPDANLETKERLELRPKVEGNVAQQTTSATEAAWGTSTISGASEPKPASKPLTREELMNALGGRRTMAQDIEAVRMKREADKNT